MTDISQVVFEHAIQGNIDKQTAAELLSLLEERASGSGSDGGEPIAIIGMALRVPEAGDPQQFWELLAEGRDCIRPFPAGRMRQAAALLASNGAEAYAEGGYLEDIDRFDPAYFRISPMEANLMDPSQRLFLETAWRAIEDAGYGGQQLKGSATGVYVGYNGPGTFGAWIEREFPELASVAKVGNIAPIIGGRLSYLLDLRGPNLMIDTACSSSLVAVHAACRALRSGECETAIAGGVKISPLPLPKHGDLEIDAPDHRAKAFDERADGTSWGEGAAAIVLKPLARALADGDAVYAVIKGSAVNHDGTSIGLTAPSVKAQEELLVKAWTDAGVDPATIRYVEAHGTGTKLGDPIEVEALNRAFARYTEQTAFCAISSVKTNLGHLDSASGIIGLIKSVLALRYRQIPPTVHFSKLNPAIDPARSAVWVSRELAPWPSGEGPLRCGVSAFGISGTNCHVVLEEAPATERERGAAVLPAPVLALSAKTAAGLARLVGRYAAQLEAHGEHIALADLLLTANTGRGHYEHRAAIAAADIAALRGKLTAWAAALPQDGDPAANLSAGLPAGVYYGHHKIAHADKMQLAPYEIGEADKRARTLQAAALVRQLAEGRGSDDAVDELCRLYVSGAEIDWAQLFDVAPRPRRISLPTYPFERVVCWPEAPTTVSATTGSSLAAGAAIAGSLPTRPTAAATATAGSSPLWPVAAATAAAGSPPLRPVVAATASGGSSAQAAVAAAQIASGGSSTQAAVAAQTATGNPIAWNATIAGDSAAHAVAEPAPAVMGGFLASSASQAAANAAQTVTGDPFAWNAAIAGDSAAHAAAEPAPAVMGGFPAPGASGSSGLADCGAPKLHPLVDRQLAASYQLDVYATTFRVDTHWELHDHIIYGQPTVPGTSYVEMARFAGERLFPGLWVEIGQMIFFSPLTVERGQGKEAHLIVHRESAKAASFTIASRNGGAADEWTVHAEGRLSALNELPAQLPDLQELKARMQPAARPDAVQSAGESDPGRPIYFGPRWSDIVWDDRYSGANEWLGRVGMPEAYAADLALYGLQPALLDVAVTSGSGFLAAGFYLPLKYEAIRIYGATPARFYTHYHAKSSFAAQSETISYDVTLYDEQGRVFAEIINFMMKKVRGQASFARKSGAADTGKSWFHNLGWCEAPEEAADSVNWREASMLVFGEAGALSQWVIHEAHSRGAQVYEVVLGKANRALGDGGRYEIAGDEESYGWLLAQLAHTTLTHIVYMRTEGTLASLQDVQTAEQDGVLSLFRLSKKLVSYRGAIELLVVAREVHRITGAERLNPLGAMLFGLSKVVRQEYGHLRCKFVDVDGYVTAGQLLGQFPVQAKAANTALRGGRRYIEQFDELQLDAYAERPLEVRDTGVYVITGGTGGLGLETAFFLASRSARHIALVNRSSLPERALWSAIVEKGEDERLIRKIRRIAEIEQLGVTVHLFAADTADRVQLAGLLNELRTRVGPLRGIVHSAGVAGDKMIHNRPEAAFRQVLAPKAEGTWLLHELTAGDELDFMVLYSSITGLFGDVGQCDYTAANAFMDAFAVYRSALGKRTLSVNWPAWKETGMAVDYKVDNEQGVFASIANGDAFAQLERLWNRDISRAAITELNVARIKPEPQFGVRLSPALLAKAHKARVAEERAKAAAPLQAVVSGATRVAAAPAVPAPVISASAVGRVAQAAAIPGAEELEAAVAALWREVLGLKTIDVYESFYELGGDSILAVQLARKLEREFPETVDLADIFTYATVHKLAKAIAAKLEERQASAMPGAAAVFSAGAAHAGETVRSAAANAVSGASGEAWNAAGNAVSGASGQMWHAAASTAAYTNEQTWHPANAATSTAAAPGSWSLPRQDAGGLADQSLPYMNVGGAMGTGAGAGVAAGDQGLPDSSYGATSFDGRQAAASGWPISANGNTAQISPYDGLTAAGGVGLTRSGIEEQLIALWCEVLDLPAVDAQTSFYELGGDSILAVQLSRRLEQHFPGAIDLADIFTYATIDKLTEVIADKLGAVVEIAASLAMDQTSDWAPAVRHDAQNGGGSAWEERTLATASQSANGGAPLAAVSAVSGWSVNAAADVAPVVDASYVADSAPTAHTMDVAHSMGATHAAHATGTTHAAYATAAPYATNAAAVQPDHGALADLEREVARLWCEVLDLPSVNVQESFYELGGDSILAVQLSRKLEQHFPGTVDLADIFTYATVRRLSGAIAEKLNIGAGPAVAAQPQLAVASTAEDDVDRILELLEQGAITTQEAGQRLGG